MARTTNSDTLPFVESRFELGMLASQRVRDLNAGIEPVIEKSKDKPTVQALREIATGELDMSVLRHEFVQSYKDTAPVDVDEDSVVLEVKTEDPTLRGMDAELEGVILEPVSEESIKDIDSELDAE